jgi:DNA-binding SARP family transcriptional activator
MVAIRLLGKPTVGRTNRSPRGRKTWALLAYLMLAERPPSRRQLAELLFADADDPLGALRWTLAELRRCLGDGITLEGDPLRYTTADDTTIDVLLLGDQDTDPAVLLEMTGELLEGLDFSAAQGFDSWLIVERHRLAALLDARLRQAAVGALATGHIADGVAYAARVVAADPLDEGNHELLIRALAMSGDQAAALRQVALAEDVMYRELGVVPSPTLRDAASTGSHSAMTAPVGGRSAALSELDAGRAAIAAGAVEAGLQCLRRAVAEADRCADVPLKAKALNALGGALVHAARGRDEEGAILLREAVELAEQAGDEHTAVVAYRELGYVEVQAGRRQTADTWLARADAIATTDEEHGAILGVRGMSYSDHADYPTAFTHLHASVEHAERAKDRRQQAWSLSLIGRAHLLRGEPSQATDALTRSIALVQEERWIAFLPWPQTLLAELTLDEGNDASAADALERAWHLARQLNDACWEGMAARGLGLLSTVRRQFDAADRWLAEAAASSARLSDRNQWVHGHVLDTLIELSLDRGDQTRAAPIIATLSRLAARCDMRELVVRAHLHRHRSGDSAALPAAALLARDIDNPALESLLRRATGEAYAVPLP